MASKSRTRLSEGNIVDDILSEFHKQPEVSLSLSLSHSLSFSQNPRQPSSLPGQKKHMKGAVSSFSGRKFDYPCPSILSTLSSLSQTGKALFDFPFLLLLLFIVSLSLQSGFIFCPLHEAVVGGNLKIVSHSLTRIKKEDDSHGIGLMREVNKYDAFGRTPLSLAVKVEREDIVNLLIGHGANPSYADLNNGLLPSPFYFFFFLFFFSLSQQDSHRFTTPSSSNSTTSPPSSCLATLRM